MNKKHILSFDLNGLKKEFQQSDIASYRAEQVFNWIYQNGVLDFDKMSNLPVDLIKKLDSKYTISKFSLDKKLIAEDGTQKYLWKTADDKLVESVFLPYYDENRYSICVSSQIGCSIGCKFCATGIGGLKRDLNAGEIIEQILKIQIDISEEQYKDTPVTNIVFMGMGEPFLNYDNLNKAVSILNDKKGLNIGMRKMTISTSGIIDKIKRLADENQQIGLAISLNAPNDELRDYLMPINKKYDLDKLMESVQYYIDKTNRRVTFEYVLMKGINDKKVHAEQLVSLLKNKLVHVNLIPVNPVPELNIERPNKDIINYFKDNLEKNNIPVTIRIEKGTNIKAACGQLRASYQNGG
ncbi:MAG TPA: 23S rRNA (adenine(2503)-C(2))-methyltransferase RlmN [Halanaerobiales bacterium]|nr:23S rRNA (adenine(2503)-C(2))-methyltransferase RlmN [Halanaerobiales bacterium]